MNVAAPIAAADSPRRDYLSVQALRFLAAFAVVVLHNSYYTQERLDPRTIPYVHGANGVRLFFVISGFVMIVSSQKLIGAAHGWRVFALRRILRVVPLYWGITLFKLVTMLTSPAVVLHARLDWAYTLESFLFIPATNVEGAIRPLLGVGWTLNYEMFFYALFAAALALRIRPLAVLTPVLALMALLSLVKTRAWAVPAFFLCDPIVLDFLAGMIIAHLSQRGRFLPRPIAAVATAAGLIYLFGPTLGPPFGTMAASLLMTLAASATVLGAISLEPLIRPRLPAFVLFMGAASYSLYLVHPIIAPAVPQLFAKAHLVLAPLSIALGVTLACLAAAACYSLIETPIAARLDGWARRQGLLDAGAARDPHLSKVPIRAYETAPLDAGIGASKPDRE